MDAIAALLVFGPPRLGDLVVTGVSRDQAMGAIDDVASRKHADRLKIRHPDMENANSTASICLLLWQLLRPSKSSSWAQPSFQDIDRVYSKYQHDIEWVLKTIGAKIDPGCSSGGAPVLAPFVFVRALNRAKIDRAARAYKSGDNLTDNDPMRRLRQKVTTFDSKKKEERIGNKNSSSQSSRYSMSLYTLDCLERVLTGNNKSKPTVDEAVLVRLTEMLKNCPTAVKVPRNKALPALPTKAVEVAPSPTEVQPKRTQPAQTRTTIRRVPVQTVQP